MKTQTPIKRAARRLAASLAIITALATNGAWAADAFWSGASGDNLFKTDENWDIGSRPTSQTTFFDGSGSNFSPNFTANEVVFDAAYSITKQFSVRAAGTAENPLVWRATDPLYGLTCATYDSLIGYNTGDAYLVISNGTWSTGDMNLMLGYNNTGWLRLKDVKTFTVGNLQLNKGSTAILDGSTLVANQVLNNSGSGSNTLQFEGGTLKGMKTGAFIWASDYLSILVGEKGGTIENGTAGAIRVGQAISDVPGETGRMTFAGKGTIKFTDDATRGYWTGGTTIELGVQVDAEGPNSKAAIIDRGLVVDGCKIVTGSTTYTVFYANYTGAALTQADLDNVTLVNCGVGTTKRIDGNYIKVDFVAPAFVGSGAAVNVFPGKTLDQVAFGDFTARFAGRSGVTNGGIYIPDSATGCNKRLYVDEESGSVTNVVVEFQAQNGVMIACVVVSFTDGEDGVYAKGLAARYISSGTVGGYGFCNDAIGSYNGSSIGLASTYNGNYYALIDVRVTNANANLTVDDGKYVFSGEGDAGRILPDKPLVVPSGATLRVSGFNSYAVPNAIQNNGTIVKAGELATAIPFDNGSTGTTIVSNGTLKVASVTGSGTAHTVRVKDGATFDLNGKGNLTVSVRLEGGASYVNTEKLPRNNNYNVIQPTQIVLEGNATVTAKQYFGLNDSTSSTASDHVRTDLELGANTLTVNGGSEFMMYKTTISGSGTIVVDGARLTSYGYSQGTECTVEVLDGGTLNAGGNGISVCNFVNNGTVTSAGTVAVTGTLTPGNEIPKLTLASGAMVKATGTAQVVSTTFAASGTIKVDASEITKAQLDEGDVAVLTVPAAFNHSGATWNVTGAAIPNAIEKWRADAGGTTKTLYIGKSTGLTVVFW